MAITDKTRKTLWARSGNRCAMCRIEIVADQNDHNKSLNIGDECHIVSSQPNGPRHISNYNIDYDSYDNLILLCKNHHRTIDELWETYTTDLLKAFKKNHEVWIRTVIDNAHQKDKANTPKFLLRLTTGKQIVDIICDAHAYHFDHDEFKSQEEADFVSGLLQNIQDWGEVSGLGDFEIGQKVQLGYELNRDIEELENRGFFIFGERCSSKMTNANKDDLGILEIATIVIIKQDNPAIINAEKLATQSNPPKA